MILQPIILLRSMLLKKPMTKDERCNQYCSADPLKILFQQIGPNRTYDIVTHGINPWVGAAPHQLGFDTSNTLRHSRPEIAITQHTFIALAVLVIGIDIVMLVALSI
jgi:hypothetical protein